MYNVFMTETYTETYSVEIEKDLHTSEIRAEIWRDELTRIHRGHGLPAIIKYGEGSIEPIEIEFRFQGLLERKDGPAIKIIDPETRVTVREEWYRNDERHRNDGPALIVRDKHSGEIVYSEKHVSDSPLYSKQSKILLEPKLP